MTRIAVEIGDVLRPGHAGMGRYAGCLLSALERSARSADIEGWAPRRRALSWLTASTRVRPRFFAARPPRERPQLFHATACVFPPWRSSVEIATVHDLYAVRAELGLTAQELARRTAYIVRADRVICVSRGTREELHRVVDIPRSHTVAIALAADSRFVPASPEARLRVRRRYALPHEFLLFLGRDRPNKNLDRLVTAHARSAIALPLCIAGRQSRATRERLSSLARVHRASGEVRWLGYVPDDDLPPLLSAASALCLPSTLEGFGLPIIEAMACGTAVLTSMGHATEEAAGGHAVLVDPMCVDSIADGMLRVLARSEAQCLAAQRYATSRTWDDVAGETWRLYEAALGATTDRQGVPAIPHAATAVTPPPRI